MRFALLDQLAVSDENGPVELRGAMPRTVLAVLLLHANTVVSADRLVEALWNGRPPASAMSALYNHVMRLRRQLGDAAGDRVRSIAPGYSIKIAPGELDLDLFAELFAAGRAAGREGRWVRAAEDLRTALALWPGSPGDEVPDLCGRDARLRQFSEERWLAWELLIEADFQLGRHAETLGDLRTLVSRHPLREVFHGQLMIALHHSNQQAEALDAYQRLRLTLVGDLGVEPSPAIQRLQHMILNDDPAPATPDSPAVGPSRARAHTRPDAAGTRCQLPTDTRAFEGRTRELDQLILLAMAAGEGADTSAVLISAIDGMGGIGKTALAVHAAHRLRDQFPDGQFFIDLRGHAPGLAALTASEALDTLLRALGVAPTVIPTGLEERSALYRERVADTRTLIILDDAASTVQVRPLLPGTTGCLVMVTSRKRLTGLDDAHSLSLDVLSQADAAALVQRLAGPGRVPEGDPAIPELLALCGHLPLAVRITASRLCHRRTSQVGDIVEQLRDERTRIDRFKDENRDLGVVFELSYRQLSKPEQLMFRRLSLVPGPDFDAYAAAHLIAEDVGTAELLMESLLDHNLLIQQVFGRYRFHDLVSLFARAVGEREEQSTEREAAMDRLLDYYEHTAGIAGRMLDWVSRPGVQSAPTLSVQATTLSVPAPPLPDRGAAVAWMRTEQANLLGAIAHPCQDLARLAKGIALTSALAPFLEYLSQWEEAVALHQNAVTAARAQGDRLSEANATCDLGSVAFNTGDFQTAYERYESAMVIYQEIGHQLGQANTLFYMGRVKHMTTDLTASAELEQSALLGYRTLHNALGEANAGFELARVRNVLGDLATSAELFKSALSGYRALGQQRGAAQTLWSLGTRYAQKGDTAAAFDCQLQANAIFRELGIASGEGNTLVQFGRLHFLKGDFQDAARSLERALSIFRERGHPSGQANALKELGRVQTAQGDFAAAADLLKQSLELFGKIGDRQGEAEVRVITAALVAVTDGPHEALALYHEALSLARSVRSPLDEADALEGSADCLAALGDHKAADAHLRQAAAIYRRLGITRAGKVGPGTDLHDSVRSSRAES